MTFDAITIEPKQKADACIIWLHGLGADGGDFAGVVPSLGLADKHAIRFIFPHAPDRPVTLNAGYIMPAWYDIVAIDFRAPQDEKGIKESEKNLQALIHQQIKAGIPCKRILLMGFSQGGALALHTALRFEQPLAGVGVLSGYLPLHPTLAHEKHSANATIPIFMAHGTRDPVVPYVMGQQSFERLQQAGFNPVWHPYPMEHTVCIQELIDIGQWINHQLPLVYNDHHQDEKMN